MMDASQLWHAARCPANLRFRQGVMRSLIPSLSTRTCLDGNRAQHLNNKATPVTVGNCAHMLEGEIKFDIPEDLGGEMC